MSPEEMLLRAEALTEQARLALIERIKNDKKTLDTLYRVPLPPHVLASAEPPPAEPPPAEPPPAEPQAQVQAPLFPASVAPEKSLVDTSTLEAERSSGIKLRHHVSIRHHKRFQRGFAYMFLAERLLLSREGEFTVRSLSPALRKVCSEYKVKVPVGGLSNVAGFLAKLGRLKSLRKQSENVAPSIAIQAHVYTVVEGQSYHRQKDAKFWLDRIKARPEDEQKYVPEALMKLIESEAALKNQ